MRLDDLIKELTEIHKQYGNLAVELMRCGVHLPEIELYVSDDYLYIEGYEEGEV